MCTSPQSPEQEEELEAIAAIFGDEIVKGGWAAAQPGPSSAAPTPKNRGTKLLAMKLPLAAPVPMEMCCAQAGVASMERISSLPPINLLISLPPGYPRHSPPAFNIDAPFLSIPMLEALAKALIERFIQGLPVLYEWADFILGDAWDQLIGPMFEKAKERAIARGFGDDDVGIDYSALNLDGIFFLELDDFKYVSAVPAKLKKSVQRCEKPFREVLQFMLDHCDRVDFERLQRSYYTCPVCMEKKHGRDCLMLRTCRHISCMECLSQFWSSRIKDGLVTRTHIVCMDYECRSPAVPEEIARVVTLERYERYEQLMLVGAILSSGDSCLCPRPFCQQPASKDYDEPTLGRCAYCAFVFCTECEKSWHGKSLCTIPEDPRSEEPDEFGYAYDGDGEEEIPEDIFEEQSGKAVRKFRVSSLMRRLGIKPCPVCCTLVSKDGGCSHMKCRCGADWCWICSAILSPPLFICENNCLFSEDEETQEQFEQLVIWLNEVAYGQA